MTANQLEEVKVCREREREKVDMDLVKVQTGMGNYLNFDTNKSLQGNTF